MSDYKGRNLVAIIIETVRITLIMYIIVRLISTLTSYLT